ncbi:dual-specificity protein phosphatase [Cryptosporidium felis]|nr:dual-specificity protein phosphatase [Cryptosporidium felis]
MAMENIFRCKKCGCSLFTIDHIIFHDSINRTNQESRLKTKACTSFFISQTSWMENYFEQKGKIVCPNKACGSKLGYFCWFGGKCSCGHWQVPSFQIHMSKVDHLPDSRKLKYYKIEVIE